MKGEIVSGIVRRAEGPDLEFLEQVCDRKILSRDDLVAAVPYRFGAALVQDLVDAEVPL